jgi:hypothetical protein
MLLATDFFATVVDDEGVWRRVFGVRPTGSMTWISSSKSSQSSATFGAVVFAGGARSRMMGLLYDLDDDAAGATIMGAAG